MTYPRKKDKRAAFRQTGTLHLFMGDEVMQPCPFCRPNAAFMWRMRRLGGFGLLAALLTVGSYFAHNPSEWMEVLEWMK